MMLAITSRLRTEPYWNLLSHFKNNLNNHLQMFHRPQQQFSISILCLNDKQIRPGMDTYGVTKSLSRFN